MSDAEDETVPLLPSLDEEFDEHIDVKDSHATSRTEGRSHHTGTRKTVLFAVIVLCAILVLVGTIAGITLAVVEYKHGKSGGKVTSSSSLPIYSSKHSSGSTESASPVPSRIISSVTFHTISVTSTTVNVSYTTHSLPSSSKQSLILSSGSPSSSSSTAETAVLKSTPTVSVSSSIQVSRSVSRIQPSPTP